MQPPFPEAIPTGSPITIASDGSKYLATFGDSVVLVNVASGSFETYANADWKNFRIRFNNTLNYYAFCESGAHVVRLHDHKIVQHISTHNPQVLGANMTSGRFLKTSDVTRGRYDFESGRYFAELRGLPFMRPNGDLQTYVEGRVVDYVREPPKSTDTKVDDEATYLEKGSVSLEQTDGYEYFNWTGDGNQLWSVAKDSRTIRIWNRLDGKIIRTVELLGDSNLAQLLAILSSDGRTLLVMRFEPDPIARIWQGDMTKPHREIRQLTANPLHHLAFSHDGQRFAFLESKIHVYSVETGKEEFSLEPKLAVLDPIFLEFSPTGRYLVAARQI